MRILSVKSKTRVTKPSAASRTVDMFTGTTQMEAYQAAVEEVKDEPRGPALSIEESADRYRASAFVGQEWSSKYWPPDAPIGTEKASFRWSRKGDFIYLEQVRSGKDGRAYHYAGVMFPVSDWEELIEATSAAHKVVGNRKA